MRHSTECGGAIAQGVPLGVLAILRANCEVRHDTGLPIL
jgi:hypothetical protein